MTTLAAFPRKASGLVRKISARDALICNMTFMGFLFISLELPYGAGLYPGVNLPLSVLFVIPATAVIALTYAMLTISMPRTGGDYVTVGRIIHPAVGFMVNFYFTMVLISWVGSVVPWGTQTGLGGLFSALGMIWNNGSFLSLGVELSGFTPLSYAVSAILILISTSIIFVGVRAVVRIAWALFILSTVGLLVYLGVILAVGHQGFVANFNAMSGTTVDAIVNAAYALPDYPRGFLLTSTVLGTVYIFLGTLGYTGSAYYSGEVKGVARSQVIAMVGAVLLFALIVWPVYAATYSVFGGDFVNALSHLAIIGDPSVSLPTFPSLTFLVVFITQNPLVVAYVNFAFLLTCIGSCGIVVPFIATRNLFAWAYDRVIPTKVADLDRRGNPYIAIAIMIILSQIVNYLYYFTPIFQYLAYSMLGWFVATAIVSIAAAAFPYRRRDLFDASPPFVKKKIAGIPAMTILGVISFFVSIGVAYATITPAFVGTLSFDYVLAVAATLIIGPIIYYIGYYYQKSRGIPIHLAHSQLPPE
jgi:APA family basic amino acid/polyamine antiporter